MTFSDRSKLRGFYPNPDSPGPREQPDAIPESVGWPLVQDCRLAQLSIPCGRGASSGECTRPVFNRINI